MAPVNLNKNKDAMIKAHKEVSDPKNQTNWALYGYEGQTDVLKLISTGDGGIEELTEDLSSGKILYAYIKVIDPNTNLPKFVFVNWGAHVSINARTEDDVDEKSIMTRVSKASGANYSFHKEQSRPMPAPEPVGSVYQKVKPQIEIKPDIREKFWEKNEQEERQRIVADKQRMQQEKAKLDQEIKSREERDAKAREQKETERVRKIREIREAEKKASAKDQSADNTHWNTEDARRDEEERARRGDQMRKDRAAEAKALVAGRSAAGTRGVFEQKPTSQFDDTNRQPAPARKLQQPAFLEAATQPAAPAARKQPIQLPKEPSPASPPSPPPARASPPPARASPPPTRASPQPEEEEEELYDDASTVQQQPQAPVLSAPLPRRPPSDDEEDAEDYQNWDEEPSTQPTSAVSERAAETGPDDEDAIYDEAVVTQGYSESGYMEEYESEELYQDAGDTRAYQQTSDVGPSARALYDYQAAEENEITFDPDEIITDIDMIDEGWWVGTAPDGNRGMFPANYVELI